jgi:hypothetical protein
MTPAVPISTVLAVSCPQFLIAHFQNYFGMYYFMVVFYGSAISGVVLFVVGLNAYFWRPRWGGVCILLAGVFALITMALYVLGPLVL